MEAPHVFFFSMGTNGISYFGPMAKKRVLDGLSCEQPGTFGQMTLPVHIQATQYIIGDPFHPIPLVKSQGNLTSNSQIRTWYRIT